MKSMSFTWKITVSVNEDEVREFLGLDEDDETELTYSDFKDCAWSMVEEENCVYDFVNSHEC